MDKMRDIITFLNLTISERKTEFELKNSNPERFQ